MTPTVGIIAPGMMGSGIAGRLTASGVRVRTSLAGRSAASIARAEAAGMIDATEEELAASDIILSVIPPGEALALADRLAPAMQKADRKPIYVDCNAVSPATVLRIADIVAGTGSPFVDGGIIGPPPEADSARTRIYLSGPAAAKVAILQDYGLSTPVLQGPIGAASALKMSYSGITKGFTALGAAMMLASTNAGTVDALLSEMQISQPALLGWLTAQMPRMPSKAYRWVAEMEEIGGFIGADQSGRGFYHTAARLYEQIAADVNGAGVKVATLKAFCAKAERGGSKPKPS